MKFTYEFVKDFFEANGCVLLEREYINSQTKMSYLCVCGNESKINFNNFRLGKRCGCGRIGLKRLTGEEVKLKVESKGYEFISWEYLDGKNVVKYICRCGKEKTSVLAKISEGQGCSNCRNRDLTLDFDFVKKFFADHDCELLETEYKSARTKMQYRCSCGNISSIVFDSFRRGNRCKNCGTKKRADKQRGVSRPCMEGRFKLDEKYIHDFFKSQGCELLGEYVNAGTPMDYRCCCGTISRMTWSGFRSGVRCKNCFIKRESGENNYQWRSDRDLLMFENRLKQSFYRVSKQVFVKGYHTRINEIIETVGYTTKDFMDKICNQENWEELKFSGNWEIDHIYPVWAFIESGVNDIKLIQSLENIRAVTKPENRKKCYKFNPIKFVGWLKSKGVNIE